MVAGPPAKAMWALGDKIASSIVAQTADVPTLPWTGSGLKLEWTETGNRRPKKLVVPSTLYVQATVRSEEEGLQVRLTPFHQFRFYFCIIRFTVCSRVQRSVFQ